MVGKKEEAVRAKIAEDAAKRIAELEGVAERLESAVRDREFILNQYRAEERARNLKARRAEDANRREVNRKRIEDLTRGIVDLDYHATSITFVYAVEGDRADVRLALSGQEMRALQEHINEVERRRDCDVRRAGR